MTEAEAKFAKEIEEGYEYDNLQDKLNRMSERELTTECAQKLMDRTQEIREGWRK